jgi:hypothetical protein
MIGRDDGIKMRSSRLIEQAVADQPLSFARRELASFRPTRSRLVSPPMVKATTVCRDGWCGLSL